MNNSDRRSLGATGIEVSPICYGCAAAYGRTLISDEQAENLFMEAIKLGINYFDTGHSYGLAEERIGKALHDFPEIKRENLIISTKFGTRELDGKIIHDVSPDWIEKSVELSLKRMGIDYIDILFVHGPKNDDLKNTDMFKKLEDLKSQRIIRAFGANSFDSGRIKLIADEKLFDVVMLDYNVVKQEREFLIKQLYDKGIGVVAGQALAESVFLKSLFKVKSKKDIWYILRTFGRKESRELYFKARKYQFLNKLDGFDGSQVALKYVLDNPYVATASIGTCSIAHLEKNVESLNVCIPEEIIQRIKNAK